MNKETEVLANEIYSLLQVKTMSRAMAEILWEKSYRKSTEVAEEIFAEIEHLMHRYCNEPYYTSGEMAYDIAELKKKYTESEKDK